MWRLSFFGASRECHGDEQPSRLHAPMTASDHKPVVGLRIAIHGFPFARAVVVRGYAGSRSRSYLTMTAALGRE